MKIREAVAADASQIHALILHYAAKGLLLPRNVEDVARDIDTFTVCEQAGAVVEATRTAAGFERSKCCRLRATALSSSSAVSAKAGVTPKCSRR